MTESAIPEDPTDTNVELNGWGNETSPPPAAGEALLGILPEPALLARYAKAPTPALEEELMRRFEPLARSLAMRYRGGVERSEDLMQVANLALVKALRRYDPSKGARFAAFAAPTILGELRRHFRDHSWRMRVPRSLQERTLEVRKAVDELSEELGTSPPVGQIAKHLDIPEEDVIDVLMARESQQALSLDWQAPGEENGTTLGEMTGSDDPALEAVDAQIAVERCATLEPREREVLRLRFGQDLSQHEIGEQLGVSQMQVSRILRRAMAKLLEAIQGEESPDGQRTLEAARRERRGSRSTEKAPA